MTMLIVICILSNILPGFCTQLRLGQVFHQPDFNDDSDSVTAESFEIQRELENSLLDVFRGLDSESSYELDELRLVANGLFDVAISLVNRYPPNTKWTIDHLKDVVCVYMSIVHVHYDDMLELSNSRSSLRSNETLEAISRVSWEYAIDLYNILKPILAAPRPDEMSQYDWAFLHLNMADLCKYMSRSFFYVNTDWDPHAEAVQWYVSASAEAEQLESTHVLLPIQIACAQALFYHNELSKTHIAISILKNALVRIPSQLNQIKSLLENVLRSWQPTQDWELFSMIVLLYIHIGLAIASSQRNGINRIRQVISYSGEVTDSPFTPSQVDTHRGDMHSTPFGHDIRVRTASTPVSHDTRARAVVTPVSYDTRVRTASTSSDNSSRTRGMSTSSENSQGTARTDSRMTPRWSTDELIPLLRAKRFKEAVTAIWTYPAEAPWLPEYRLNVFMVYVAAIQYFRETGDKAQLRMYISEWLPVLDHLLGWRQLAVELRFECLVLKADAYRYLLEQSAVVGQEEEEAKRQAEKSYSDAITLAENSEWSDASLPFLQARHKLAILNKLFMNALPRAEAILEVALRKIRSARRQGEAISPDVNQIEYLMTECLRTWSNDQWTLV